MGATQYKHLNTETLPGIISDVVSTIHDEYYKYNTQGLPPGKLEKRLRRLAFLQDIYSSIAQTREEAILIEKFMGPLLWNNEELAIYNELKATYKHCQDIITNEPVPIKENGEVNNVMWQEHSSEINLQINNEIHNPTPEQQHRAILQDVDSSIMGVEFSAADVLSIVSIIENSWDVDGDIIKKFAARGEMTITEDFTNYKPYARELLSESGKAYEIGVNRATEVYCLYSEKSGDEYMRKKGFNSSMIPLLTDASYRHYYETFFKIFDNFENFCEDFDNAIKKRKLMYDKRYGITTKDIDYDHIHATLSGGTGFNLYLTNKIIDKYEQLTNKIFKTTEDYQQLDWLDKYRAKVNDLFKWGDIDFKLKMQTNREDFETLLDKFDNFLMETSNLARFDPSWIEFNELGDLVLEYDDEGVDSRIINMYTDKKETEIEYRAEENILKYDIINIYKDMEVNGRFEYNVHVARIYRIFVPIKGYLIANGPSNVVNYKMEVFDFSLSSVELTEEPKYNRYGEECYNKLMSSRKNVAPLRKNIDELIELYFEK